MAFGTQIFKPDGTLSLDIGDMTGQVAGMLEFYGSTPGAAVTQYGTRIDGADQYFTIPNVPAGKTPWYLMVATNVGYDQNSSNAQASISGNTIAYWIYSPGNYTYIMYGYR